jgi:hypothetical protein
MPKPTGKIFSPDEPMPEPVILRTVEIARSFSFKLNLGNYQSADFFQSAKSECRWDQAEEASDILYQFCKKQVLLAVNEARKEKL